MKLKKLIKGIPNLDVRPLKDVDISGICNHSQLVAPGNLFIAKKGLTVDGTRFVSEAVAAGAVAVMTDMYDPFLKGVIQLVHPRVNEVEGVIAERFYQYPSDQLRVIGVTGTNGKTTTCYLIRHLLEAFGQRCGLIGTIEWIVGSNLYPSSKTTPDILTNQKLLHEMCMQGCRSAVMEVSSHALDQGRTSTIDYDVAVFTNLTQDHLDYHDTMENYAAAKAKLFESLGKKGASTKGFSKKAVLNYDSPWFPFMRDRCSQEVITYGFSPQASLYAGHVGLSPWGITFDLHYQEKTLPFVSSLIGQFNVYNCLAACAVGVSLGYDLLEVVSHLRAFRTIPGRLERVSNDSGKHIFVDYAHTEDALKNVLETLRGLTKGKLICVFGCGGNRDAKKRPKMGAVAEQLADEIVLTNDNPRNEDPHAIIEQILKGIHHPARVYIEPDRRKAIERSIQKMSSDDLLLIAGKGHETYQVFSHQTLHFNDRLVAQECCL